MDELIDVIDEALELDSSVCLSLVIGRRGSLPMARRAKMLVLEDGSLHGTVGGGCLEAEVYGVSQGLLGTGGASVDTFHLNEVEEGLGGHVCGGSVTILSRPLRPGKRSRAMAVRLRRAFERRERPVLGARLPAREDGAPGERAAGWLLWVDGELLTDEGVAPGPEVLEACARARDGGEPVRLESGEKSWFLEPLQPVPRAVVFGAGHCGRAIARVASLAGFRTLVADDRPAFLDPADLEWADAVELVDFERVDDWLRPGPDDYLVIVTRGHDHDLTILRQVVEAPVAYLGMIGSERKRLLFESILGEEDVAADTLRRLHSPMGLDIGADTPEEIAVAVTAEMIRVRRGAAAGRRERFETIEAPDPSEVGE